ncbi:MAG TPA: gluconate:H+ symporter [Bacteroidales bacterium]|nr:gluconate:H+ symporter [Bacteroidales bacterium]
MSSLYIIFIVVAAVTLLLLMVLKFKLSAFVALLITSIIVGLLAGMPLNSITESIQEGMGSTLGFIAVVVGLGAIFGQMLESSGGAKSLSKYLLKKFGKANSSWALMLSGFLIGIPIFLDVGFIILIPIVYALSRNTGKSLLFYAIPLLAGLAVTHTMVPPTPGPMAVAKMLGVDIGYVVLFGIIVGLPSAAIAGPLFGKFIAERINVNPPPELLAPDEPGKETDSDLPSFWTIFMIILTPLFLILVSTFVKLAVENENISGSSLTDIIVFLGHPFTALLVAALLSILFCLKRKMPAGEILDLSTRSLGPAGIIILVTGAGGVLKQVLIDSGIGEILARSIAGSSFPLILLAWILASVVRITQGSATVAMITAAGIMAPILTGLDLSQQHLALIVISIAAGATIMSHVNDSGFWIVSKYLGMNEKQTLRSWTIMETIIALSGLAFTLLLSLFIK